MTKLPENAEHLKSESSILEVANLALTYPNGKTVLNGISFEVHPKETFVILGGSGCGKSSLLNILIGILEPTHGQVRIAGQDIHRLTSPGLKSIHLQCGILYQSGALLESLTVLENVCLPLREHYRGISTDVLRETGRLKLRMVGLEDHGDKRPSGISGGMRKRVALARALALDPVLVFADEPTSGLDPISTKEIDELFIRLTRRIGAAAVVVTHDIASFFRIANRAVLLGGERDGDERGRVILRGTPDEFTSSTHPLVRQFLDPGSDLRSRSGKND